MEYLALFFTTSGSIKFRKKLKALAMEVEALPVPRKLSSGCGIAVKFHSEDVSPLIDESVEKIYRKADDEYHLTYESGGLT